MKTPLSPRKKFHERRGIALVSVLVLVVLLTAVIIGFWATSTLEYNASRSYKATSTARLMADMAINLAQGQINEATSQGMATAWASQPGAIRVYDNTGALKKIYKLYSAQNLTTTSVANMDTATTAAGSNDMPPTQWANSKALWVDLNAPANDASGTAHFPIFNESNAVNVDGFSIGTAPGAIAGVQPAPMPVRWLYVLQNGQIIAPDVVADPTATTTVLTFVNAPAQPSANNPIVGRIAFWTDDETCKVNINTAGGDGILGTPGNPTDPTPIANATFWDIPRFTVNDDENMALTQPANGEFQRYPGHPATVALHNVLYGLGWINNTEYGANPSGWTAMPSTNFYSLLPRYSVGGSLGATAQVKTVGNGAAIPLKASPANHLYSSVAEMLFALTNQVVTPRPPSVLNGADSATQQKIETARFFLSAHSRAPEVTLFGQPRVSVWPEMVTTKELSTGDPLGRTRTAIDQLLAFCATTNSGSTPATTGEYYFSRYDPMSCTADINLTRNVTLLKYLDYFTASANDNGLSVPGYGGNFETKYGQLGMRQILTEIFDYIRTINIADCNLPNTKTYSQPILTSSINTYPGLYEVVPSVLNSTVNTSTTIPWGTQGIGIYPRLNEIGVQFVAMGQGAGYDTASKTATPAVPLNSVYGTPTTGYGVSGTEIFGTGDAGTDPNNSLNNSQTQITQTTVTTTWTDPTPPPTLITTTRTAWVPPGNSAPNSITTRAIQAFLMISFTNPSQMQVSNINPTYAGSIYPAVWIRIIGLDAFKANGNSLRFPHDSTMLFNGSQSGINFGTWDTFNYINMFFQKQTVPTPPTSSAGTWINANPFYSQIIPLKLSSTIIQNDSTPNTFTFTGGKLTIILYDGGGVQTTAYSSSTYPPAGLKVVQTYTLDPFPSGTFTMPNFPPAVVPPDLTNPNPYTAPVTAPVMGYSIGISNNSYVAVSPSVPASAGPPPTAAKPAVPPALANPGDRWLFGTYPWYRDYALDTRIALW